MEKAAWKWSHFTPPPFLTVGRKALLIYFYYSRQPQTQHRNHAEHRSSGVHRTQQHSIYHVKCHPFPLLLKGEEEVPREEARHWIQLGPKGRDRSQRPAQCSQNSRASLKTEQGIPSREGAGGKGGHAGAIARSRGISKGTVGVQTSYFLRKF